MRLTLAHKQNLLTYFLTHPNRGDSLWQAFAGRSPGGGLVLILSDDALTVHDPCSWNDRKITKAIRMVRAGKFRPPSR
jgi:hypothetical protein